MDFFFQGFDAGQIAILITAALLIGINKTGIPGIGLVPVLLLTMAFPTRMSTGLQLVMLCMADVLAVIWYRRDANWKLVLKLIPAAAVGLIAGTVFMKYMDNDRAMALTIGIIVLGLCIVSIIKDYVLKSNAVPSHWSVTGSAGFLAGFTTLVANAAGPIMAIYFLSMKLEKKEYIGTGAWYFLIINWTKLPIFWYQGRITQQSFCADLAMIPFVIVGGIVGIIALKHISQVWFNRLVIIFSIFASLKLIFF